MPTTNPTISVDARTRFPYFQYTSVLGTFTILLSFTAVFLPASTSLITPLPPQQSSLDKPQHPLLVPITASPVWTLFWLCLGTGACQGWWAGWMRQWWAMYPHQDKQVEGVKKAEGIAIAHIRSEEGKLKALRNACINTVLLSGLFYVIIVIFGAPLSTHIAQTYLFSLLISILAIFVPAYTLSLPPIYEDPMELHWIVSLIFSRQRRMGTAIERALIYPVYSCFLGCWLGAFPIALDWDRPWQAWPLTPSYGALVGYLFGSWWSLIVNVALFLANQDLNRHPTVLESSAKGVLSKKQHEKKRE